MEKNNESEDVFVKKMTKYLSQFFKVEGESSSKCRTGRVDLVVSLDGFYFGIECKKFNKKRGADIGDWMLQAMRYKDLEWNIGNGKHIKMPILICPPLSYEYFLMSDEKRFIDGKWWHKDRHELNMSHHSFNGLLGQLGVGEVRRVRNRCFFVFSNFVLWNEPYNKTPRPSLIYKDKFISEVHSVNYNNLMSRLDNK